MAVRSKTIGKPKTAVGLGRVVPAVAPPMPTEAALQRLDELENEAIELADADKLTRADFQRIMNEAIGLVGPIGDLLHTIIAVAPTAWVREYVVAKD